MEVNTYYDVHIYIIQYMQMKSDAGFVTALYTQ